MTQPPTRPDDPAAFLAEIRPRLEQEIQETIREMTDQVDPSLEMAEIGDLLRVYLERPGKRLRPLLFLLTLRSLNPARTIDRPVLGFAAGLQVFHEFLLVHDDLIDSGETRRGGPTLWRSLASNPSLTLERARSITLVLGDLLYARAIGKIAGLSLPATTTLEAMRLLTEIAGETGWGAVAEIKLSSGTITGALSRSIQAVYRAKTTRYTFEGPMTLAAILAGSDAGTRSVLKAIAHPLGFAFQLENDLHELVAMGDLSSPASADLKGHIKTLPMIRLFESLGEPEKAHFADLFDHPLDESGRATMAGILRRSGIIDSLRHEIRQLFNEPLAALANAELNPTLRDNLAAVVRFIRANRNHSEA